MNQETLNKYFGDVWQVDYDKFNLTGFELLRLIDPDAKVLDVGCGFNLFKPHLNNLWGIDPANDKADELVTIEDFEPKELYDIALCLGSLNFGNRDTVFGQTAKVVECLKPGGVIYWRQNPGLSDHPWKEVEEIKFYPWTFRDNLDMAQLLGCEVERLQWDTGNRIFAVWKKIA